MAVEPFMGQIQAFGFNFNPVNWVPCDGRLLSISEYEALYTLIGTIYGGDGVSNFAVPDLRGRVPLCMGQGPGLSNRVLGQKSGHEAVTITQAQMPSHSHVLVNPTGGNFMISDSPGLSPTPTDAYNVIGAASDSNVTNTNNAYNNQAPDVQLNTNTTYSYSVSVNGMGQPIENMEPYLTINFCICTQGIFPTRS